MAHSEQVRTMDTDYRHAWCLVVLIMCNFTSHCIGPNAILSNLISSDMLHDSMTLPIIQDGKWIGNRSEHFNPGESMFGVPATLTPKSCCRA